MPLTWQRLIDLDAATAGEQKWGPDAQFYDAHIFGGGLGASTINALWRRDGSSLTRLDDGPRSFGKTRGAMIQNRTNALADYLVVAGGIVRDGSNVIDDSLSRETLVYHLDAAVWEAGRLASIPLPGSGSAYLDLCGMDFMPGTRVGLTGGQLEHEDLWLLGMNNDAGVPRFLTNQSNGLTWSELAQPFNGTDVVFGARPVVYCLTSPERVYVIFLNVADTPRIEAWEYAVAGATWTQHDDAAEATYETGARLNGVQRVIGEGTSAFFNTSGEVWTDPTTVHETIPVPTDEMDVGDWFVFAPDLGLEFADYIVEADAADGSWFWEIVEEDTMGRRFDQADFARGTPAHTFVSRKGGAAQPVVGDFRMLTRMNGGLIGCTGRVRQDDVEHSPNVLREDSEWWVNVRQTGKPAFKGHVKEPGFNGGIVDMSADGVGTELAAREFRTLLYADDGLDHWRTLRDVRVRLHAAPEDAPDGFTIAGGAGNLVTGTYQYAVSFVTAELESGIGPKVEIPVLIGESPANIHLRNIPTGGQAVTARKVYRKDPGGAFRLLTTINDSTTETYDDSTASVAGNDLAPDAPVASPIQSTVEDGAMLLIVEKDETVLAEQRGGFVWYVPVADATAIRIALEQNRSLDNWELQVATGEGGEGPWFDEGTLALAGNEAKRERFDFTNPDDIDTIRLELRRLTDGADTERVEIVIFPPRVYGAATDDDYSTSDVARDICRRLAISDGLVKPTGTPALPQLWTDGNFGAVLDFNCLLTEGGDYRWLMLIDGAKTLMDFGPSRRRRWILSDPEVQPDLLPLPRYSRVKVYDHEGNLLAEATADPNILGFQRTAPAVRLPFRVGTLVAQRLAQALADYYVQRHWTGSITIPRVWSLNGIPKSHFEVLGGDQLLVPRLRAFVTLDEVENTDQGYATATVPSTMTLIDRLVARLEHARVA